MKSQTAIYLIIASLILFQVSCTNADAGSVETPTATAEKKEKTNFKSKKKQKKKFITGKKRKTELLAANEPKKEEVKAPAKEEEAVPPSHNASLMNVFARKLNNYAIENGYSTKYCFLIDMSIPSGRNRFFVYDLEKNTIVYSALVAHGNCNEGFRSRPKFSNMSNTGCSSLGKYKVGEFYNGKYGRSYRLHGLDNSNSNAFKRGVVIHGYDCVPDKEIYPMVLCNSLGCPMVSFKFFERLSRIIEKSEKPILVWIYS